MSIKYEKGQYARKKHNFYTIIGIIGDILFYPIIIISLFCCLIIYTQKQENKVPSLFGVSIACVSSGSMTAGGFNEGDIVFLHNEKVENLRCGDIVAFYYKPASISVNNLTLVQSYDRETGVATEYNLPTPSIEDQHNRLTLDEVRQQNTPVYFHRIIKIYTDKAGVLYFQTQGDSNSSLDNIFCGDYIVGEYSTTPQWIRSVFSFIASSTGMIVLVVVPLSILIFFMLLSIIEQISKLSIERKVLRREIRFDSEESIEANIGIEMEKLDKIQFYANSPLEDRAEVAKFLWEYLKFGNAKEQKLYSTINYVTENFNDNPSYYWRFWIQNAKTHGTKNKIEKLWQEWDRENSTKKVYLASQSKSKKKT